MEPLRQVRLPGGVVLNFARAGRGPALVLVHGAMGDWRSWEAQWADFTAAYDCVTYSRRYSYPNPNRMPSPDHSALVEADDLAHFLDALDLPEAILVGSSYGGFTALALAVRAPGRVRAVVAVEPPLMRYAHLTPEGAAVADAFRRETVLPANDAFRRGEDLEAARIMTGGIAGAAVARLSPAGMERRMQNVLAMKMLALSTDEFPWIAPETLAALPMPVLMVSGAETPPVHAAIFANLVAAMPRAERQVIAGAGHSVTRDRPDVFNALVLDFLRRRLG